MPSLQSTEKPLWGHPHSTRVRRAAHIQSTKSTRTSELSRKASFWLFPHQIDTRCLTLCTRLFPSYLHCLDIYTFPPVLYLSRELHLFITLTVKMFTSPLVTVFIMYVWYIWIIHCVVFNSLPFFFQLYFSYLVDSGLCTCGILCERLHLFVCSRRAQEALKTGHFVSVLQVLMQLQRVCNHPDLLAPRQMSSSYLASPLQYNVPSLVLGALQNHSSKVNTLALPNTATDHMT